MRTPRSIVFGKNGTALVKDRLGQRIVELEGVTHADTIGLLRLHGFNYQKLEVTGAPTSYPVRR